MAIISHCQRILPLITKNTRLLIAEINRAEKAKIIPEYSGPALNLMLEFCGWERVFVIDAVITGKTPPGTVRLFTEKEICGKMKPNSFHSVNLPQALIYGPETETQSSPLY